jgi:hypothetical protein
MSVFIPTSTLQTTPVPGGLQYPYQLDIKAMIAIAPTIGITMVMAKSRWLKSTFESMLLEVTITGEAEDGVKVGLVGNRVLGDEEGRVEGRAVGLRDGVFGGTVETVDEGAIEGCTDGRLEGALVG